jgi:hypothetical protein
VDSLHRVYDYLIWTTSLLEFPERIEGTQAHMFGGGLSAAIIGITLPL